MMCATLLRARRPEEHGRVFRAGEAVFQWVLGLYRRSLTLVLRHPLATILVLAGVVGLNIYLYIKVPKDFFPQQDIGRVTGQILADQDASYQSMERTLEQYVAIVGQDPAVDNLVAFYGGGGRTSNTATMFIALKPLGPQRRESADQVIGRLYTKASRVPGASLFLQAQQDVRIGAFSSNAQYQYTLQGDDLKELSVWAPRVLAALRKLPGLTQVNSNQQDRGLNAELVYDRATAKRLGLSTQNIDDTLYDAFGQRQVSTMYTQLNQYHVVMEVDRQFSQDPDGLRHVYARNAAGQLVPLSAFASYGPANSPLAVNHQSQYPAVTISFNLQPSVALGTAVDEIDRVQREIGLPPSIHGRFAGTAQAYQAALANQLLLICAALAAVYIVLGMLYESYMHPITILSTLPSAGVGALLALLLCHTSLTLIALVGIILLIGIVKKNAIMMIDVAIDVERREGKSPKQAIFDACLLRFRPIMMTTMAALLGGLPLAVGGGVGSELRRPLGIAIVGGLILSQALTLYTTPVVYLYLDRFRLWLRELFVGPAPAPSVEASSS
jgi:multidrug efflux pump